MLIAIYCLHALRYLDIYIYINMGKTKNRLKRMKEGGWEGFLYIYGYVNKDEAVGRNAMTN